MKSVSKLLLTALVAMIICLPSVMHAQTPHWSAALPEELEGIRYPLPNGNVLVQHENQFWCFDGSTGAEQWKTELADLNQEGVNTVIAGDLFLVSSKANTVQAYKASDGKKAWETNLDGIDQSDYSTYADVDKNLFLRYDNNVVRIEAKSGKELFRSAIDLYLKENGAAMYQICSPIHRVAAYTSNHTIDIFNDDNGQKIASIPYEPHTDLIERRRVWRNVSRNEQFLTVVDKSSIFTIDLSSGKETARTPFTADADLETITDDSAGCMLMGEDKLVFVSGINGKHYEQPFTFVKQNSMSNVKVGGKWLLILSTANGIQVVDQSTATLLWKSAPSDPQFAGWLDGIDVGNDEVAAAANSLMITMVEKVEGDHPGNYLYAMAIDPLHGAVRFRTLISVFKQEHPWYRFFRQGGNTCFIVTADEKTWSPDSWSDTGEGIVGINNETGSVVFRNHTPICAEQESEYGKRPIERVDDRVYVVGNNRILCFDLTTGKTLWQTQPEFKAQVFALSNVGDVLYAKVGCEAFTATYTLGDQGLVAYYTYTVSSDKFSLSSDWTAEPFGILALDAANGKILWNYSLETDPAIALGQFTVNDDELTYTFDFADVIDTKNQLLYLCDLESIHALKLGRSGGTDAWTVSLADGGLGTIEHEDAFGYDVANERLSQPVRMLLNNGALFVFGQEAIGKLNLQTGKSEWQHEWNYSREKVQYRPYYTESGVVYGIDGHVRYLDLTSGKVRWDIETNSSTEFLSDRDGHYLISWDDESLHGWWLR